MSEKLSLGYSTCPNDTFIFEALVNGRISSPLQWQQPCLEDVETLNAWAIVQKLDVTKISCHALAYILDQYCVLSAGAALGRGCGPLLVANQPVELNSLAGKRVAIPGKYTTAALLLQLLLPRCLELVEMRFDLIMEAIRRQEVDAGVIIHESRFTYQDMGLFCLQDLGEWWEQATGQPIPLGCIVARRSLGRETIRLIEKQIAQSLDFARRYPEISLPYIRQYSQEMTDEVMRNHIELYVNSYSIALGDEGYKAIAAFLDKGRFAGILPPSAKGLRSDE